MFRSILEKRKFSDVSNVVDDYDRNTTLTRVLSPEFGEINKLSYFVRFCFALQQQPT